MTPENVELIRYRLRRAKEALGEARVLLEQGFTMGVVNRAYYACFYAVAALLLTEGLSSSKHSGMLSLFNRHWIKSGRLSASTGAVYNQLFERRQTSDYKDMVTFELGDVERWLNDAVAFVAEISLWLRDNAGIEEPA